MMISAMTKTSRLLNEAGHVVVAAMLIVASIILCLDCCPRRRPAAAAFGLARYPIAVAFVDIHLKDDRVMHEAIDDCERHRLVREHLAPFAERLVCRDP